jgi:hypothetical protein
VKFVLPALLLALAPLGADTVTATVKDSSSQESDAAVVGKVADAADPDLSAPDADSDRRALETPAFYQLDPRGHFANGGRDYCCPVALSNSLVYLARHGYPDLLPAGTGDEAQIDLINQLASPDYLDTNPDNGTGPGAVLSALQKYISDKGYTCARLEYEGWRSVGRNHQEAVVLSRADLDWIKSGIRNPRGAVWLNVGWYQQTAPDQWKRTGGHWVALVGVGPSGTNDLLIHNSLLRQEGAPSSSPGRNLVHLDRIPAGTLQTGPAATEDAAGLYQVAGPGLPLGRHVDAAFLDAAIVLVLR